jgi:phage FluMu gp28-like protein
MDKTTCAAAYLLWKATFTPDCTILVAANKLNQATEIMERIKYGYADLPDYIKCGVTKFNEGTVSFDNGSKILARATTPDAGRGLSISVLYLDEFAFVPPRQAREFWTAIRPTLATGGDCIVTSTPNGDVDQFAQIYHGAIDNLDEYGNLSENGLGKNGFYGITVPWWRHPDRDEAWAQAERSQLGDERFRREYECVGGDTMLRLRDHDRTFVSTPLELFNRLKMIDQNVAAVR